MGNLKPPYKYSFFNTIEYTVTDLKAAIEKADTQNLRVFLIFKHRPFAMTPVEVHKHYCDMFRISERHPYIPPLTSIRRAISTLTRQNLIVKTDEMGKGAFGVRNYKWIINS